MAIDRTKLVRIAEDLAEKLGWIRETSSDVTTAEFLDPLIRPAIDERYAQIADAVEQIKAVRARHSPAGTADLGSPVG